MRCHICDRALSEPNYNTEIEGYEPCDTCLSVINDTLASYEDRPAVEDDELGIEISPEELEYAQWMVYDRYDLDQEGHTD